MITVFFISFTTLFHLQGQSGNYQYYNPSTGKFEFDRNSVLAIDNALEEFDLMKMEIMMYYDYRDSIGVSMRHLNDMIANKDIQLRAKDTMVSNLKEETSLLSADVRDCNDLKLDCELHNAALVKENNRLKKKSFWSKVKSKVVNIFVFAAGVAAAVIVF